MPPRWCGADAPRWEAGQGPRGPGRPGYWPLDEHVRPAFEGWVEVSPPADPEASRLTGSLADPTRRLAGQREIPLIVPDAPAHDEDAADCGSEEEDHDSDDEEGCGHDSSPYFWPPAVVPPSYSVPCPVWVAGVRRVLGPRWLIHVHPRSPVCRMIPVDLAILVIPTFGTTGSITPHKGVKTWPIPKILKIRTAGMILFSPVGPAVGLVGTSGRCHG